MPLADVSRSATAFSKSVKIAVTVANFNADKASLGYRDLLMPQAVRFRPDVIGHLILREALDNLFVVNDIMSRGGPVRGVEVIAVARRFSPAGVRRPVDGQAFGSDFLPGLPA